MLSLTRSPLQHPATGHPRKADMPLTGTISIAAETPEDLATATLLIQNPNGNSHVAEQLHKINHKLNEILEKLDKQALDQETINQIYENVTKGKGEIDAAITGGTPTQ